MAIASRFICSRLLKVNHASDDRHRPLERDHVVNEVAVLSRPWSCQSLGRLSHQERVKVLCPMLGSVEVAYNLTYR